jgi:hypothetical protein
MAFVSRPGAKFATVGRLSRRRSSAGGLRARALDLVELDSAVTTGSARRTRSQTSDAEKAARARRSGRIRGALDVPLETLRAAVERLGRGRGAPDVNKILERLRDGGWCLWSAAEGALSTCASTLPRSPTQTSAGRVSPVSRSVRKPSPRRERPHVGRPCPE